MRHPYEQIVRFADQSFHLSFKDMDDCTPPEWVRCADDHGQPIGPDLSEFLCNVYTAEGAEIRQLLWETAEQQEIEYQDGMAIERDIDASLDQQMMESLWGAAS